MDLLFVVTVLAVPVMQFTHVPQYWTASGGTPSQNGRLASRRTSAQPDRVHAVVRSQNAPQCQHGPSGTHGLLHLLGNHDTVVELFPLKMIQTFTLLSLDFKCLILACWRDESKMIVLICSVPSWISPHRSSKCQWNVLLKMKLSSI